MTENKTGLPSKDEMEARIRSNLKRLQGYIEVLLLEIEDPSKSGPGSSKDEWKAEAEKLQEQLEQLKVFLGSAEEQEKS